MVATDVLLGAVAGIAAVSDWQSRTVPNWLTLAGFVSGCIANTWTGGLPGLGDALAGAGLALLVHVPLWLLRASGGGDVKLMAALGAIAGLRDWLMLFAISAVLGGVAAIAVVLWRGAARRTLRNIGNIAGRFIRLRPPALDVRDQTSLTIPRGVVVGIAVIVFLMVRR